MESPVSVETMEEGAGGVRGAGGGGGCCSPCCSCCRVNRRLVPVKASYFFTLAGECMLVLFMGVDA